MALVADDFSEGDIPLLRSLGVHSIVLIGGEALCGRITSGMAGIAVKTATSIDGEPCRPASPRSSRPLAYRAGPQTYVAGPAVEGAVSEQACRMRTYRRSCATEMLRSGANMYHVKELLGHESLETLKHYAKLTITDLKRTHHRCHPRERDEER